MVLNKKDRPRVVYWNNIPAPYMVERFNALADRANLDFEAWFNERLQPDRSWEVNEAGWRFPYQYIPSLKIASHRFRFPLPLLSPKPPDVIVSLYAEPCFLVGWAISQMRGIKIGFWCQVTMDSWVKRREWKNRIKRFVFSRVDATFGSGQESRAFAMSFGTPPEQAFCLPHAIDVKHYSNGRNAALPNRESIRSELGLQGVTFIYMGRLWWGKGVNYLLDAFHELQNHIEQEVSLLLVGDGEDGTDLKDKCRRESIRNVVFAGFKQKSEIPCYFAASDVFVFPTLGDPYGLVVDEAMACSLPVISTNAAGEIRDRIEDGINGYIVLAEDSNALFQAMKRLAGDRGLRTRMGSISAEKIKEHTPERWAEDFEKMIKFI
jgi:glycosyltransferase involved in cell wall biosynthesis